MIQDITPHRYDVSYQRPKVKDNDIMLIYGKDGLLCRIKDNQITYPSVKEVAEVYPEICKKARYLFCIDEQNYFELPQTKIPEFGKWTCLSMEKLRYVRPIWKVYAGITGFQMHKWYAEHQYCGCCGSKMEESGEERALRCTKCGKLIYPSISPSVIVGIMNGDRILMTKYSHSHSRYRKYALVAGYVETGESLEDTVRREVMEEVGLHVKNIRYYKSQPWSFTDTLLVGFFCEVDGDDKIIMDEEELSAAEWFDRDHLPIEHSEAEISLTGEMIEAFQNGYGVISQNNCKIYEDCVKNEKRVADPKV